MHGPVIVGETGLDRIRTTQNLGCARKSGNLRIFQGKVLNNDGYMPPLALSPEHLFPALPFCVYMYE